MNKKIWPLILLLAAALLAGCGGQTAPPAAPPAETPAETPAGPAAPIDVNIGALKGPTAMGMVKMMADSDAGALTDNNYNFKIFAAIDEVTPALVQGELDIAAVPANLSSVLYNNADAGVRVLAINTLGVLYIVENGETVQSIGDLAGKTVYASGKGATPEFALRYILQENGLSDSVTLEWLPEHAACVSAITSDPSGIAMLPQPFVATAQAQNSDLRAALDLTAEWDKLQTGAPAPSALITGVIVARTEFVRENPDAVNAFLDHYKDSVAFAQSDPAAAAELIGGYDIVPAAVALKALPYCNIVFIEGAEMKEKLAGYLGVLLEQSPEAVGGALPPPDFYYAR
ncbi:MAG: ABC transporter substrate-binding protein [Gracilibacteraceae bacterium]|nr:ABC transporter substrate-binding protein [Gracilibacteraceae bacterium]